ncbi:MAG: hypothetical protein KF795_31330 [Labilithrix sp.]|nr:hypothetical protein [Labilithrix sp.]
MSVMDCQTFDSSLLDALYDELDEDAARAFDAHAASCAACAERRAALETTLARVRPALELKAPTGLEARVLAAAEAAAGTSASSVEAAAGASTSSAESVEDAVREGEDEDEGKGKVIALADRARPRGEAKRRGVVALLARPDLAVAATFLLVLGAAAVLINGSKREAAPSATAQAYADEGVPAASAHAPPVVAATAAPESSAIAYAVPLPAPAAAPRAEGASDPNELAPAKGKAGAMGRADGTPPPAPPDRDAAFVAAKALFDAGRYAEALPRFESLTPSHPAAELYVARCIANTQGCGPAIARYDRAAQQNAGSETGSRAALEAARCANRAGQMTAARSRYQGLATDSHVAAEAQAELEALEAPRASAKAAKPTPPPATATATATTTANADAGPNANAAAPPHATATATANATATPAPPTPPRNDVLR